jgi:hypothetical protein
LSKAAPSKALVAKHFHTNQKTKTTGGPSKSAFKPSEGQQDCSTITLAMHQKRANQPSAMTFAIKIWMR